MSEYRHAGSTGQLPPGQGLFGSPAYMAPEQVKACLQRRDGMPRGPLYGAAADCWAFGLTMFELLTGQTLFGAKKEAPQEEWDHVEAAREFHERQIAAEHQSWVRSPQSFFLFSVLGMIGRMLMKHKIWFPCPFFWSSPSVQFDNLAGSFLFPDGRCEMIG